MFHISYWGFAPEDTFEGVGAVQTFWLALTPQLADIVRSEATTTNAPKRSFGQSEVVGWVQFANSPMGQHNWFTRLAR